MCCALCLGKSTYWAQIIAVGGTVLAKEKGPGDNLSSCVRLVLRSFRNGIEQVSDCNTSNQARFQKELLHQCCAYKA